MIRIALLCLLISACSQQREQIISQQFFAFGTLIDISYSAISNARAVRATQSIEAMFLRQHHAWHAWEPGALQKLNHAIAAGKTITVPDSIITLIRLGQQYEKHSQGRFNPAIGLLLRQWGFQQNEAPVWQAPDPAKIKALVALAPSSLQLRIQGNQVSSRNPAIQLDFGAFAKGYAVGKAMQKLEQMGIHNALVNAGGDLCVIGRHSQRNWRVGIRHPRKSAVLASVELKPGQCVFTSGDYERYAEQDGKRIHHIINPATGYSATETRSVTVVANNPSLADAAATALFVAGPEHWTTIARGLQVDTVLLVDAQNTLHMTPAMAELLQLENDTGPEIRISAPVPLTQELKHHAKPADTSERQHLIR